MTISQATLDIEQYFVDNFTYCDVDYLSPSYTPSAEKWLQLSVAPIVSDIVSYSGCTQETFDIHLVGYGNANKREASLVTDEAISLIKGKEINNLRVKTWRTNASGVDESGVYFHKVIVECVSTLLEI